MTTQRPVEAVLCGCMKCYKARVPRALYPAMMNELGWRYACEICGNKRCPHHSDHTLACTGSNEPNQTGSQFTTAPVVVVPHRWKPRGGWK